MLSKSQCGKLIKIIPVLNAKKVLNLQMGSAMVLGLPPSPELVPSGNTAALLQRCPGEAPLPRGL